VIGPSASSIQREPRRLRFFSIKVESGRNVLTDKISGILIKASFHPAFTIEPSTDL
jgi:hypothetical protein